MAIIDRTAAREAAGLVTLLPLFALGDMAVEAPVKKSILFAADNHYNTHGGRALYECLRETYAIRFAEDDWPCFSESDLAGRYSLVILNMISGTCGVPLPPSEAEENILAYLKSGRPVLLLHAASAAFWQWDWWRRIVGLRWVRPDDPDGFEASCHPTRPYTVRVSKCRHPLGQRLHAVVCPEDEIYEHLEQTSPLVTLMETTTDEGTFPMCYEAITPWRGRMVGYLPGHAPQVVTLPENVLNCRVLIDWLLALPRASRMPWQDTEQTVSLEEEDDGIHAADRR